ncbi:helix-turn-helix domain-containing protein [Chitinophaga sp. XS-30]|uniref:winged helix-turn-helix transcriptional regulator n=1 Tax=Chitinophaga sp. XS-30 TaxID=2604421 RepID=UPI0011DD32FB|nr:helix-turn-helix domain-containing protein [Chitinophaga sp. XS-30]QEH39555.1 helix-turn-helix transcriptional regulator [Chitinophaga sp. XS-30]
MRKESSTNAMNEDHILRNCGMAYTLSVLGGRWKPAILFRLLRGPMRYSELLRSMEGVSERMLVAQLRELEKDGLVKRTVHAEVPPRVEYGLTAVGRSAEQVIESMSDWGNMHRPDQ